MKKAFIILTFIFATSMSYAESLKADCASVNQKGEKSLLGTLTKQVKTNSTVKK